VLPLDDRFPHGMRRIALTGGIASGKSYVASRLQRAGVPVVDADVLARDAVRPGSSGLAAVVERFGRGVLTEDGSLDRARLGEIVFRDRAARRDLEAIVHPYVRREIEAFFERVPPEAPFAVADIPLLYETGRQDEFDAVVVVACSPHTQLARLMARAGMDREEAERRIAAQMPLDAKVKFADHVIHSDGAHRETDAQVSALVEQLRTGKA
jgi:dephospho-CoA kinase